MKKERKLIRKPPEGLSISPTFLFKRIAGSSHVIKRLQRETDHLSNLISSLRMTVAISPHTRMTSWSAKGRFYPYKRHKITINKERSKQYVAMPNTSDVPPTRIKSFPHIFPNLPLIIGTSFSGLVRNLTENTLLVCNNSGVFPLFFRNFSCVNYVRNLHAKKREKG